MAINPDQLIGWADDLEREITILRAEIDSRQMQLAELERKKAALDYLAGAGRGGAAGEKFGVSETSSRQHRPPFKDSKRPDHAAYREYWEPILQTLVELGGKGHVDEILRGTKRKMENNQLLHPRDYEDVPSGTEEYWRNMARWQRKAMVDRALLRPDSPRGIWEITDEGRKWLRIAGSGGTTVKKTVYCAKCGKQIEVEGPSNNSKEVPQNVTCPNPNCKHPGEVMWPMGGSYKVRLAT